MSAESNKITGSDYEVYMRPIGSPITDNKLIMCQTDFSISQSKNDTEEVSKCGRDRVKGIPTREASLSGFLSMPEVIPGDQEYIDQAQLQTYFDTDESYAFTLMPKETATSSTGVPQMIAFEAELNTLNTTWPAEGSATFETALTLDAAPVYSPYVFTT